MRRVLLLGCLPLLLGAAPQGARPTGFAGVGPPAAASRGGAPASLSEDEAVALALSQNPDLRAFRKGRAVAEGEVVSAAALSNPELRLDLLHVQERDPGRLGFGVGLQWAPPQPIEYAARRAQAGARLDEVRHEIAEREWALAGAVRAAHATLLELDEQRRLAEAALELRRRIAAHLRTRLQHGEATRLEQNLGDLSVLRARRELDDGDLRRAQAQAQLQALLGVASDDPLPLRGALAERPGAEAPPDPAALFDQALAARPALRAAHARVHQREHALRAERTRRWPWLRLSGRYRHNDQSGYPRDVQLGVDLSLPLLNLNGGPIRTAQAERERDLAAEEALLQSLQQRVRAACAELKVHRAILARFRGELLPVLAEHERLMEAAARGAQVDLVALLGAEEGVLRGRRDYSEARLLWRRAWLSLEGAVGARLGEAAP